MNPIIAILSDFGHSDSYVASMKGVILSINPSVLLIDISHGVPRGDVFAGAFCLASCLENFPPSTIFLAVVDPGVGTERCAIALQGKNYSLIGPDNGLLALAAKRMSHVSTRRLENYALFRSKKCSATFHGRDVFAPAAAHLSLGFPFEELGAIVQNPLDLPWPPLVQSSTEIQGQIIYVDHFGNCVTNIPEQACMKLQTSLKQNGVLQVSSGNKKMPLLKTFGAVPAGEALAYVGSEALLALAVNKGNASSKLQLHVGDAVVVQQIST